MNKVVEAWDLSAQEAVLSLSLCLSSQFEVQLLCRNLQAFNSLEDQIAYECVSPATLGSWLRLICGTFLRVAMHLLLGKPLTMFHVGLLVTLLEARLDRV